MSKASFGRAGELLGWQPVVPLAEGLAETCAWFAAELGAEAPSPAPV